MAATASRLEREQAVAVRECPYCSAATGVWCQRRETGRRYYWYVHQERMRGNDT